MIRLDTELLRCHPSGAGRITLLAVILMWFLVFIGNLSADDVGVVEAVRTGQETSNTYHTFESVQMGMPFHIVIFTAVNDVNAEKAAEAAFTEIQRLNSIFSDYEYGSELSQLSRTSGTATDVVCSGELWDVISRSVTLHESSGGLFDITIGPASALWRKARREKQFPLDKNLEMVRGRTGMDRVILNTESRSVRLDAEHMRLDLGGIAKGVAIDAAAEILQRHGCRSFMVRAGGDMMIGDAPEGEPGWKVVLLPEADVPGNHAPRRSAFLANCAVGTSGDIFQFVEIDGKRFSHILDPRTCVGLVGGRRAVVLAQDATTADSHATIACLMGVSAAPAWFAGHPDSKAEVHVLESPDDSVKSAWSDSFFRNKNHQRRWISSDRDKTGLSE